MSDQYYRAEYRYLVDEGREFAERYPDLARELNLLDSRGRDPNVERLLEGLAFLTSRVHKRLDDDFPHLVEGLLSIIWPHHGQPIPSFCICRFRPLAGDLTQGFTVPRGAVVESESLENGLRCRYRTTADLWVGPFTLNSLLAEPLGTASRLNLEFGVAPGCDPKEFGGHKIRMQIFGEWPSALQLYDLILGRDGKGRNLAAVKLTAQTAGGEVVHNLGAKAVGPVGLSPRDALLPRGTNAFWGFGLLEDYFVFKDKFLAFEMDIADCLAETKGLKSFSLGLEFGSPWPQDLRLGLRNLLLNCVPLVNLFKIDGEPIRLDHLRSEYRVEVDIQNPDTYQVFSLDQVEGIGASDGKRRLYQPLLAIRNPLSGPEESPDGPYYVLNRGHQKGNTGEGQARRTGASLGLVDPQGRGRFPQEETLSISLTASNGPHGSQPLPGQINQAVEGVPETLKPHNLSQPTAAKLPSTAGSPLWSWLGHVSLNYLHLDSAERLKTLMSQYMPLDNEGDQRRVEGILSVNTKVVRERVLGSLVRGNLMEIELDEEHFSSSGDLQLFAGVLDSFLGCYATINSFVRVVYILRPSGKKILMDRMEGGMPL